MTRWVFSKETEVILKPALLDELFDWDVGPRATTMIGAIQKDKKLKRRRK